MPRRRVRRRSMQRVPRAGVNRIICCGRGNESVTAPQRCQSLSSRRSLHRVTQTGSHHVTSTLSHTQTPESRRKHWRTFFYLRRGYQCSWLAQYTIEPANCEDQYKFQTISFVVKFARMVFLYKWKKPALIYYLQLTCNCWIKLAWPQYISQLGRQLAEGMWSSTSHRFDCDYCSWADTSSSPPL